MDLIKIWSIAVGSGQMNFAEILDKDTKNTIGLLLFDCGGSKQIYKKASQKLVKSILARNHNRINLVLISHTNAAYCNLLTQLEVNINGLLYGLSGKGYKNSSLDKAIRSLIENGYLEENRVGICDSTSYRTTVNNLDLSQYGINTDVFLRVLISDYDRATQDVSTIWQMITGNRYALFTGDAPLQTIEKANAIIAKNITSFTGTNICDFITIPHHDSYVRKGNNNKVVLHKVLSDFGNIVKARYGIAGSALHRGWIMASQYVQEAVLPKAFPMDNHICYIHDKKNMYRTQLYNIGYLTNLTVIDRKDTHVSYSLIMDGTNQNKPMYYKENDSNPNSQYSRT
jgi:hypothetical protein